MLNVAWDWIVGFLAATPEDAAAELRASHCSGKMRAGPWIEAAWASDDEGPMLACAMQCDGEDSLVAGPDDVLASCLATASSEKPYRSRKLSHDYWEEAQQPCPQPSTWEALSSLPAPSEPLLVRQDLPEAVVAQEPQTPQDAADCSPSISIDAVVAQTRKGEELSAARQPGDGSPNSVLANVFDSFCERDDEPPLLPPQSGVYRGRKTLVLDLDETLVHSFFQAGQHADFSVTAHLEQGPLQVFVAKRPGVDKFMRAMCAKYEVVIFTASVREYADPVMDILDPQGLAPHRLFREACSQSRSGFVKDLARLGRDLADIIIVDNSPLSYAWHPDNALPILSFYDDLNDNELEKVTPFLESIAGVQADIRLVLGEALGASVKNLLRARLAMLQ